jgi:hypothetical protein
MTTTNLDFETANHSRVSGCATGMAVLKMANKLKMIMNKQYEP